ncbi:Transcription initiation factor TFIID subunit 1 [Hypsibius exemplaris]|uniref:Transcription initiation factor TFIID subunit 1 n=1 Tax=Hypsibius exemplaris TaxID=2072580 RepID=A0A1W0WGM6_HYPEX|nr:Transcription initiation factor TFIID subunit 1 [Hypsibius exemplaris]
MPLVDYDEDDSDEEREREGEKPFSLTNFLFGNVSEEGKLEDDYLEEDAKEHLENLNTQRISCLTDQLSDVRLEVEGHPGETSSTTSVVQDPIGVDLLPNRDDTGGFSPSAVDFSDFNETIAVDDDYDEIPPAPAPTASSSNQVDRILAGSATADGSPDWDAEMTVEKTNFEEDRNRNTGIAVEAKPEPDSMEAELVAAAREAQLNSSFDSGVFSGSSSQGSQSDELTQTAADDATSVNEPNSDSSITTPRLIIDPECEDPAQKQQPLNTPLASVLPPEVANINVLNTPLASVLPPELANINVNDVFPDFKPDVVLRFSRLFGPGRPSSLPKRWVNFRKKTEPEPEEESEDVAASDEDDEAALERACREAWPITRPDSSDEGSVAAPVEAPITLVNALDLGEVQPPKRLTSSAIPPWRYGPAQYWYDSMGVDPTGEDFDYGASLKRKESRPASSALPFGKMNMKVEVNEEAFLMVSLTNWEQDIIWDGAQFKREAERILADRRTAAGWLPNTAYRTAAAFLGQAKSASGQPAPLDMKHDSIFPAENDDLVSGNWEKDIIWDADNIEDLPEPAVLMLDPNDPNIIMSIPDEEEYENSPLMKEPVSAGGKDAKEKKDMYKRSRMVLGKAGMLKEPMSPKSSHEHEPKNQWKDPFNLSNDEYYSPRMDEGNLKTTTGAVALQHSIPAIQLYHYFFPTTWPMPKLRQFHRSALKKYSNGQIILPGMHPVKNLAKTIRKREKQRELERINSGGGEMFFMKIPEDLSVQDGELILVEYSEEHPPLISQVGMATRVKNYLKRKPGKATEEESPVYDYGELTLAHTSPFLGALGPGQSLQALENNMFRAPIYQHRMRPTDFLIIRTRNSFFIREIGTIFTVGQECPLVEVPAPNSKKATNFIRDYLTAHIYRLFWQSTETPRRIKTEDVKKLFAHTPEAVVRKRLKVCADFQRAGGDSHWWSLKPDFRLPAEEEIRALVTPEDYCAFYSMRSAEQRLKDAGYARSSSFPARQRTTAMRSSTDRDADPTGRGEGFSYVKVASKVDKDKDGPAPAKRIVTGTDADLRKLSLNNAKSLLRKFGCKEDKIKALTRWEIIALVRELGGQQAKSGTEESMSKFARGNRFSAAEQQEKYKEESQRIFELQNRILASDEVLSTDEESEDDGDEDSGLDEAGRDLDFFIQSKKSSKELEREREEKEREELKKLLNREEEEAKKRKDKLISVAKPGDAGGDEPASAPVRKLKIIRTFRDSAGNTFDRVEYVSRPALIDAYVRIRETNDSGYIQQLSTLDSDKKDMVRKEKRRIQEQLRRGKKNDNPDAPPSPEPVKKPKKNYKEKKDLSVTCGACGQVGHMRTNKAVCPMAEQTITVAMTKEQEDQRFVNLTSESGLVKVEGAKITLKKEVLKQSEKIRQQSLVIKIPKNELQSDSAMDKAERKALRRERSEREPGDRPLGRPRKIPRTDMPEYLEKPRQATARRRVDPVVSLATELEVILNELRDKPDFIMFRAPVSKKDAPDYALYITDPIDLSTMRSKLNAGQYRSREDFLTDIMKIVSNSEKFNGKQSMLTNTAKSMLNICASRFAEREEDFKRLEKQINPLLDDDDQVALSWLLGLLLQNQLRPIEGSSLFHSTVDRKKVPNYHKVIKHPMNFDTIEQKAKTHQYQTAEQFLDDVRLIHSNCVQFNGQESPFTRTAELILQVAESACTDEAVRIAELETAIRNTMDAAETESVGTHVSDSDRHQRRPGSAFAVSHHDGDVDQAGAGVVSEMGDDETPRSPDSGDAFNADHHRPQPFDEESFSRNSVSSPPATVQQAVHLSLGGSSYYDDAQTGYEDDQEGSPPPPPSPPLAVVAGESGGAPFVVSPEEDDPMDGSSEPPTSSQPSLTRMSTLEDDLNVSDSDSEGDGTATSSRREAAATEEKLPPLEGEEEDDDGLWI